MIGQAALSFDSGWAVVDFRLDANGMLEYQTRIPTLGDIVDITSYLDGTGTYDVTITDAAGVDVLDGAGTGSAAGSIVRYDVTVPVGTGGAKGHERTVLAGPFLVRISGGPAYAAGRISFRGG